MFRSVEVKAGVQQKQEINNILTTDNVFVLWEYLHSTTQ
jgi:hypothetical protein